MNGVDLIGLLILLLFVGLLAFFVTIDRRRPATFRSITGYESLKGAIERAVEAGERVHLSLGTGSVIGSDSAPALAGLAILTSIAESTTMSDKPVIATTGDGAMAILAQDTLRSVYSEANALHRYSPISGRMLGPT
ncbi:MAG: hypothetical protein KAI06_05200, partial [Anaerolineales bacterium]|nr:hypothetical protein [Anaerolineales bacterium]